MPHPCLKLPGLPRPQMQALLKAARALGQAPLSFQEDGRIDASRPWRAYSAALVVGLKAVDVTFHLIQHSFALTSGGGVPSAARLIGGSLIGLVHTYDAAWTLTVQPGALLRLLRDGEGLGLRPDTPVPIGSLAGMLLAVVVLPGIIGTVVMMQEVQANGLLPMLPLLLNLAYDVLAKGCKLLLVQSILRQARSEMRRINAALASLCSAPPGPASVGKARIVTLRREYSGVVGLVENLNHCFQSFFVLNLCCLFATAFKAFHGSTGELALGKIRLLRVELPLFIIEEAIRVGILTWFPETLSLESEHSIKQCHSLANSEAILQSSADLEFQVKMFADQIVHRPVKIRVWRCLDLTVKGVLQVASACIAYFIILLQFYWK